MTEAEAITCVQEVLETIRTHHGETFAAVVQMHYGLTLSATLLAQDAQRYRNLPVEPASMAIIRADLRELFSALVDADMIESLLKWSDVLLKRSLPVFRD